MVAKINPLLKQKIQQLSDYSDEPLAMVEVSELGTIISDTNAELEERVLAAKVMVNVCENRLLRAQRQVAHFKNIFLALVHEKEQGRAVDSMVKEGVEKLANMAGAEELLQAMLDRLKGNR